MTTPTTATEVRSPSLLRPLPEQLLLAAGMVVLFAATGWLVVEAHIAGYTDLLRYDVAPAQIAAAAALPWLVALTVLSPLFLWRQNRRTHLSAVNEVKRQDLARYVVPGLAVSVCVILGSIAYGALVYGQVPRWLGGGKPATVVLHFDDTTGPQELGLTGNPARPAESETVDLLAELTSGVLVRDAVTNRVVAVDNRYLLAIADDDFVGAPVSTATVPTVTATQVFAALVVPESSALPVDVAVFGDSGMAHRIALYVPSTTAVDQAMDSDTAQAVVDEALRLFSDLFGGATALPATGGWVADNGTLVTERITIVYAFADDLSPEALETIRQFCEQMKADLMQEAIAIEVNGRLLFL
jgi:hypothetical protein